MGVCYSHYLIPSDNTIRPTPERIVALLEAWVEKRFIVGPESLPAREFAGRERAKAETGACFTTEPPLTAPVKEEPRPPEPPKTFWSKLFWAPRSPIRPPVPNPTRPFAIPPIGKSLAALSTAYALIEWASNPSAIYPMQTVTQAIAEAQLNPKIHLDFPHKLLIELCEDFINPYTDPYGGTALQVAGICTCGHDLKYEGEPRLVRRRQDTSRVSGLRPLVSAPGSPR